MPSGSQAGGISEAFVLSPTAGVRLLLAAWVLAVVGVFYAPAVCADAGILTVSDDAMLLQAAAEGLAPNVLFSAHGDHLVPLTRVVYFLCLHLFGTEWSAYAAMLLAAFSAMCWLVGVVVHRVSGSAAIAFFALIPFSVSPLLASAPTLQFQYFFSMAQMVLCLAAVLILINRAESPQPRHLWMLGGCAAASALISSPGLIILPLIAICAGALRLARFQAGPTLGATVRELLDLPVLRTLAAVTLIYGAAYAYGVYGLGNGPIGSASYNRTPSPVKPVRRVINFYRYGFFGAIGPAAAGDEVSELGFVWNGGHYWRAPKAAIFLLIPLLVLLAADIVVKRVRGERHAPPASELALAFLLIGVVFAILAVRARVNIYFWQAVYVEPITIFSAVAGGLSLAAIAARLPAPARMAGGACVGAFVTLAAWQNALYLQTRIEECIQLRAEAVANGRAPMSPPLRRR